MVTKLSYLQVFEKAIKALLCCAILLCGVGSSECFALVGKPIATDSRIKTFVFNENEVFPIVLHLGYQTSVEFAKGEVVQTYSVGNTFVWQISPVGRTLFIKPLEEDIVTNMTVITNKRRYYFELRSKGMADAMDEELAYVVRFFYPDEHEDSIEPIVNDPPKVLPLKPVSNLPKKLVGDAMDGKKKKEQPIPEITPYDFNYIVTGKGHIAPTSVFDDGVNTYFQYSEGLKVIPVIAGRYKTLEVHRVGNYLVVHDMSPKFIIKYGKESVTVNYSGY